MGKESNDFFVLKVIPLLSVAVFFVGWQLLVDLHIIPRVFLATPSEVIRLLVYNLIAFNNSVGQ